MSTSPRHLDALTGIRGLAAWAVVLYHVRLSLTEILPGRAIAVLGQGFLAVDLFFMLSGFVIWYNYAGRLEQVGWRSFLWRRFARVWPLHSFVLAGFVALSLVLAVTGRSTAGYPLAELPLHAALVQNWGFTPDLAWNHPAWSISTEFAAYLAFPLIVLALRGGRLPTLALLALAALLLGLFHAMFALAGESSIGADIPRFGLPRCLIEFALGCVLCLLWQRLRDRKGASLIALVASATLLALGLALDWPQSAFVPAALFTGLLALALGSGPVVNWLGRGPILYLGEISYSTYLAHFALFIGFKLLFVDASLQLSWGALLGFLALVLAASVALYHGVEKPAQRWLNMHPPRWTIRRATGDPAAVQV